MISCLRAAGENMDTGEYTHTAHAKYSHLSFFSSLKIMIIKKIKILYTSDFGIF